MTNDASTTPSQRHYGPGYRAMLLALIMLVAAFAYVDRVIVQTLGQPIKEDLGLTDFQLGLLGGLGFAILYSTLGLPIARLAERRDRITIISVSVGLFSLMSALCGLSANFWQLFLCRIGVGIGEAGVQAPSTSLIGDHFPPHQRGFAITMMRLGSPLGSFIGALAAVWIAKDHGWRTAMIAVCGPGLIVALLFRLLLRDPPRGLSDGLNNGARPTSKAATPPPPMGEVMSMMARKAVFRNLLIGLALSSMALYAGGAFTAPFFMRVHDLSITQAGVYVAIISSTAATAGMVLGGVGIDFIARRGQHWYALLPFCGIATSVPLYLVGYSLGSPLPALVCLTVAGVFLFFYSVPTLVALQNLVAPNARTTAAFIYFFIATLVGVGLGPPIIGLASDIFAGLAMPGFKSVCTDARLTGACATASAWGVRHALLASIALYALAAFHYWRAACALKRDASLSA
ncbi:spinster family MFS transporter [Sphingobium sp. B12D2B]|uniref:spinster family MFS transporter n=1 Tax=Sphingobium sp. B12D2B TaxID=2940577 RepID=UPI002224D188|nr:MFS transporter [Sphingobium sp. B12D2B]MCW2349244.1 MFS family permease [Sphingobium sp. B12D2B]